MRQRLWFLDRNSQEQPVNIVINGFIYLDREINDQLDHAEIKKGRNSPGRFSENAKYTV